MENLSNDIHMTKQQSCRYEELYDGYRRFYSDPDNATPKIIVHVPCASFPSWQEQLTDPLVMLKAQLDQIKMHMEVGDDCVPAVRVNFGTAQVAAAFGCEFAFPENSLPAAGTHILEKAEDVYHLQKPSLDAGWYGKLKEWTLLWRENLPKGVHIQHPDIQSPFNTAHLIRGNDILLDFYDNPDAVSALLGMVADYMIDLVPEVKSWTGDNNGWFFDWGAMWKGTARISNCTSDLIGPDFYLKYVLPHDLRLLQRIGGGRMHCCASSGEVIEAFLKNAEITGLDCDAGLHDLWHLSEIAPANVPLIIENYGHAFPQTDRLLKGHWPKKRNITLITQAENISCAKQLLADLRNSIP